MKTKPATLGQRLTALREARDWTRNALAVRAGISPIIISRIAREGRDPAWSTACKLADALEVRIDELR